MNSRNRFHCLFNYNKARLVSEYIISTMRLLCKLLVIESRHNLVSNAIIMGFQIFACSSESKVTHCTWSRHHARNGAYGLIDFLNAMPFIRVEYFYSSQIFSKCHQNIRDIDTSKMPMVLASTTPVVNPYPQ